MMIKDTDINLYEGFINAYLKNKPVFIKVEFDNSNKSYSIKLYAKDTGKLLQKIATGLKKKEAYNLLVFGTNMIYQYKK